jgi:hypothetical protein
MSTNTDFLSYLAHFFLEWNIFQTKVDKKLETHILCPITVFRKSCRLWDNVEKRIAERGTPQMTAWHMRNACLIPKATNTHTQVVHYSLLFHRNNCCTNAPQCHVTACLVYCQQLNVNNTAGTTQCTFGFHKMRGIFWSAEKHLASPRVLCYK